MARSVCGFCKRDWAATCAVHFFAARCLMTIFLINTSLVGSDPETQAERSDKESFICRLFKSFGNRDKFSRSTCFEWFLRFAFQRQIRKTFCDPFNLFTTSSESERSLLDGSVRKVINLCNKLLCAEHIANRFSHCGLHQARNDLPTDVIDTVNRERKKS